MRAFFKIGLQGLIREHNSPEPPPQARLSVSVDAPPWGVGGILTEGGRPLRWLADAISAHDLKRFQAALGDPAYNTWWEALAMVVALGLWRSSTHVTSTVEIRSNNLPPLFPTTKGTSRDPSLRLLLCELSLDQAMFHHSINTSTVETHNPGVSNIVPDALSRPMHHLLISSPWGSQGSRGASHHQGIITSIDPASSPAVSGPEHALTAAPKAGIEFIAVAGRSPHHGPRPSSSARRRRVPEALSGRRPPLRP